MPLAPDISLYRIVHEKQNDQLDPSTLDTITELQANTWIACCIAKWTEEEYSDKELQEVFKEDFKGQNKEVFQKANKDIVCDLRNHLQNWGVYVSRDGTYIARVLTELLQEEQPAQWSENKFQKQVVSQKCLSLGLQRRLGTIPAIPTPPLFTESNEQEPPRQVFMELNTQETPGTYITLQRPLYSDQSNTQLLVVYIYIMKVVLYLYYWPN